MIRQGDVILMPAISTKGMPLSHLTLAVGEVSGHTHRIRSGKAKLYEQDGSLYLQVISDSAILTHEEHKSIKIPQGCWIIKIQREYRPTSGWDYVTEYSEWDNVMD